MTRRRTHGRARIACALLAIALAAVVLGSHGRPSAAQDTPDAPDGLTIVSQTAWVAPSGQFVVRLGTGRLPAGTVVAAEVHASADGRIRFDRSIRGEDLGSTLSPGPAPAVIGVTPTGTAGSLEFVIPVSRTSPARDGGIVLTRPGVYPVEITATTPAGDVVDELVTHLIRLPTDDTDGPALAVGTVVELDAEVRPGEKTVRPVTTDADSAEVITVMDQLARRPSVALTIDPTPAVLAALDQTSEGRDAVQELGSDLTGRQVLAAPYVGVDMGAWIAAGMVAELDGQLAAGRRRRAPSSARHPTGGLRSPIRSSPPTPSPD